MHFVCNFLKICSKFELLTSQGSAATYLRCGVGTIISLCSKFHTTLAVKSFRNRLRFDKVRVNYKVGSFFETLYSRAFTKN